MEEAKFIYKSVQNVAHINSSEFPIGLRKKHMEADILFENL